MTDTSLLIVDDGRSILTTCQMFFERNYAVMRAEMGSDALSLLHDAAPDVVILDIGLQDMSGIDLLARIKSMAPETVVVMMTAAEETDMIKGLVKLGPLTLW